MKALLTLAVFLALTGAIVLLRFRWPRLSRRTQSLLIACACIVPAFFGVARVTHWSTAFSHLNAAFYWACIASYEFLLILFTRLRPHWLTSVIVIILLLPLLADSAFFPLTQLFYSPPITTVTIGDRLISERVPWGLGTGEATGTDLFVYYQPSWAPFLLRQRRSVRYYSGQCNADAAYAVLQPDGKRVLMACPASPGQPANTAHHFIMPLD